MCKAWEEIFIAEGSDWFWWFGDDHATHYKDEFDRLFRLHLKNVYKSFIRVDFQKDLLYQYRERGRLVITFVQPEELQVSTCAFAEERLSFKVKNKSCACDTKDYYSISFDKIMELSCPFADLGLFPGTEAEFFVEFVSDDEVIQRIPRMTVFCFSVPSKEFERMMWQI